VIKKEGYLFVYLSYEDDSQNWVYFDDFKVTHTKTNVIQYNALPAEASAQAGILSFRFADGKQLDP